MSLGPPLPAKTDSVIVETRTLVLDSSNPITPGKPKVYRAETITITGRHKAPETDLWLIAERIIASEASIDVSGLDGTPSYTEADHAESGSSPGQAGRNADESARKPAGKGGDGGRITLVCRELSGNLNLVSNGGRGGNGLSGGNGAQGGTGPRGRDGGGDPGAAIGGVGLKGGRGGNGGTGGNGGNGGAIWIAIEDATGANLTTTASGGLPGLGGKAGARGPGGDGGPGGDWGEDWERPSVRL